VKRIKATLEQIKAARDLYQDDDCEIDDDALQSPVDGEGVWVSAWVWVYTGDSDQ
jgi:hypothetical protein